MINYKTTFITYINKTSNTFEKKSLEKIALVLTQLMTKLPQLVVPLCSVNLKGKVNLLHLLLCLFQKKRLTTRMVILMKYLNISLRLLR
ncbi:Uncharacterised protein [Klebsiella pneumoniae]|nr:hypothetical protein AM275_20045 [Klebsiella pneumoniae]OCO49004.1 hypothetical protein AN671_0228530 [Klebsiella pneumoniae subsp. pneumoniae]OED24718.1 hypothetical protein BCY82_23885 [Klebsiella quasipneumoniae]OCO78970.1 hypothetical protein AN692_0228475 [Klebsiella pneumoniae subsp. pneumoniae]SVK82987.1 Uncharacterised protein [Klebsiella pneumoniae]